MSKIKKIYIISHTHTDIGYTDYQDVIFRQQSEFIDQAIELCEKTSDYPAKAQYKWTCEVSSFVEKYLNESSEKQIERFLKLHKAGRMAVCGMQYNWTPMLSRSSMIRSLYPIERLRKNYGINISSAMQCDVNGAAWQWADLLPSVGIKAMTMSINIHRGARPQPDLNAFWWEGPGKNKLLVYNGPHYLYGIFRYGLDSLENAEKTLPEVIEKFEHNKDYPYDFIYAQITHPARVDNNPPFAPISDIISKWNEKHTDLKLEFITTDDFTDTLYNEYADKIPTWRGDWTDWWADGVASSSYETAVNRNTEALLPGLDLISTQVENIDSKLIQEAYHQVSLYDEHSWGSFASVRRPHSVLTRAQYNRKANFAYNGFALTHELLTKAGRKLAKQISNVIPEGEQWRRWGQYFVSKSSENNKNDRFLIVNPLSWEQNIRWPIPPDIGGQSPHAFLEAYLVDNYRDPVPLETKQIPGFILEEHLPAFGYSIIEPQKQQIPKHARADKNIIENKWYKIEIAPESGALKSWFDKEIGKELAGQSGTWQLGQYVYESVDSPKDRNAIFELDFDREDFGVRHKDTPFIRETATNAIINPGIITFTDTNIEIVITAPGAKNIKVKYSLPHDKKALNIDMIIDKKANISAEAVYVMFPFNLKNHKYHMDLNGIPLEPEKEQINGSCRDWYGIQNWVEVSDKETSITVVPVDAPLVQLGGITTGHWAKELKRGKAEIVSWPIHNHWDTNFKAYQEGELLFRYSLTSSNKYKSELSSKFASETIVPPIIVRVPGASCIGKSGQFLKVTPDGKIDIKLKKAEDGKGIIIHAFNFTEKTQNIKLEFVHHLQSVNRCSPLEKNEETLIINDNSFEMALKSHEFICYRIL
ncbi:MAG: hypothetical protein GY756_01565 [bacterium]|nr:hypothetical protein [bacterium]